MSEIVYPSPNLLIKPNVDQQSARRLAERLYGVRVKQIKQLNGYDDKNYHVICEQHTDNLHIQEVSESGYNLKVINSLDSQNINLIEAQTQLLLFLSQHGIQCPEPVKQKSGSYFSLEVLDSDITQENTVTKHVTRLLNFKPGVLLAKVPITEDLMVELGDLIVKLNKVMGTFSHPGFDNYVGTWNMKSVPKLKNFVYVIKNETDRDLVKEIVGEFERKVLADSWEECLIHGDLNTQNIIVDSDGKHITAIIDYGDTCKGYLIFELAITMCYAMMDKDIEIGKFLLKGLQEKRPLLNKEKKVLKLCICARLCQTVTLGLHSHTLDPKNEYLLITQKPGWKILKELWAMSDEEVSKIWQLQ